MSLGSIVVRLTMNTADFETDSARAAKVAQKRAAEIDAAFKKAGTAIGVALAGAIVLGANAIKQGIDRMDEMSKAAQKVALPTEEFSRLAYAGELADVSIDTLVSSLGKLTKSQAAALKDTSQQAQVFDALGIAIKDSAGNLRNSSEVLLDFADKFKELDGSPEAMAAGFALFGRSFQDLIPLLKDGSDGLREAAAESDALGKTISTEAGRAAEEFNDNLTRLHSSIQGVWQEVGSSLVPAINDLVGGFIESTKETGSLQSAADGLVTTLQVTADFLDFVARIAKSFGATVAAAVEQVSAALEIGKQVVTFGAAAGSIADGWSKMDANAQQYADTLKEIWKAPLVSQGKAQQKSASNSFSSISEENAFRKTQGLAPLIDQSPLVDASKLRRALGGGPTPSKAKTSSAKPALSEEQRAAEQLNRAYESLAASQAERIALFGQETEVAKLTYATQQGDLKGLDEARKQALLTQAGEIDAMRERQRLEDDGKRLISDLLEPYERVNQERNEALKLLQAGAIAQADYNKAIEAHKTPAEQMLADMQFELELLGKSREEQELLTAARYLGAEAATEQGRAALEAMAAQQGSAKEMNRQIEAMDALRSGASDLITDLVTGAKSAKDAFKDFFDDMAARITKMIAERWVEQLFGTQGSNGGGKYGDAIGSIFGALFGGGKATGGSTRPNTIYEVNERGFEMATVKGRDYMLTGPNPVHVTPNHRLQSGKAVSNTNNFYLSSPTEMRTQQQIAAKTAYETKRAVSRV